MPSYAALAWLLAGICMLGPFAIDAYLPAMPAMGQDLGATPAQMQQTLASFLFGFALMNLFHGALSDSLGRKPVILVGLAAFTLTSVGCALAGSLSQLLVMRFLQGMCSGIGQVVGRTVIRDLYAPEQAQRMMSRVTLIFGLAPALAPLIGGCLFEFVGWRSIFWLLAGQGLLLLALQARWLPESLPLESRQPLKAGALLRGYRELCSNPRLLALVAVSSLPFNAMFLYILSAPAWLGGVLGMAPTQFFWFFVVSVSGVMAGAWFSGRLAGRITQHQQIWRGFALMALAVLANVGLNLWVVLPAPWAFFPIFGLALGWSLLTPAATMLLLDQAPTRRGMASSIQSCLGNVSHALVAAVLAPWVMHSAVAMALASAALTLLGAVAWQWVRASVSVPAS